MLNIHLWRNTNVIKPQGPTTQPAGSAPDLSKVKPGMPVTITGFGRLSPAHRQHLQAYGVLPGRKVIVLAQSPVTIMRS